MKTKLFFLLILILAAIVRLYKVTDIPVSLYWDEVAIGYNAYSIAETGKDEHNQAFPLVFRSFDDYKLPGQVYLTVPFVKVFGLSEFAVRLPAALMGIATVAATYYLAQVFVKKRLALLTALLLAISPWHIHFTRASFEAGSALFFLIAGATLFLRKKYFLGAIILAFSTYFYRSNQVVAPLLLGGMIVYLKQFKKGIAAGLLMLALAAPILYQTFFGVGTIRITQVGVASETFDQTLQSAKLIEQSGNSPFARIIYNRRIIYATQFVKNYFSHFDPKYVFLEGDPFGRHREVGVGILYHWEFLMIPLGIYFLRRKALVPLYWILIAIIPAALSAPTPHSLRSLNMLPMPQLLSAVGIGMLIKRRVALALIGSAVVATFFYRFLHSYFVLSPVQAAFSWGDPYKDLVSATAQVQNQYDQIVVTGFNWQPYIYFLFYQRIAPAEFQANGNNYELQNYWFGFPDWDPSNASRQLRNINLADFTRDNRKVLFVLSQEEYVKNLTVVEALQEFKSKNGKIVFVVAKLK